mmetsp:Transcript_84464/g.219826  ORF Transcript_84464/g.219826 Transcript_84464/m.219826 type:complete len:413 (-) Transcript_84464:155-1393(-)
MAGRQVLRRDDPGAADVDGLEERPDPQARHRHVVDSCAQQQASTKIFDGQASGLMGVDVEKCDLRPTVLHRQQTDQGGDASAAARGRASGAVAHRRAHVAIFRLLPEVLIASVAALFAQSRARAVPLQVSRIGEELLLLLLVVLCQGDSLVLQWRPGVLQGAVLVREDVGPGPERLALRLAGLRGQLLGLGLGLGLAEGFLLTLQQSLTSLHGSCAASELVQVLGQLNPFGLSGGVGRRGLLLALKAVQFLMDRSHLSPHRLNAHLALGGSWWRRGRGCLNLQLRRPELLTQHQRTFAGVVTGGKHRPELVRVRRHALPAARLRLRGHLRVAGRDRRRRRAHRGGLELRVPQLAAQRFPPPSPRLLHCSKLVLRLAAFVGRALEGSAEVQQQVVGLHRPCRGHFLIQLLQHR